MHARDAGGPVLALPLLLNLTLILARDSDSSRSRSRSRSPNALHCTFATVARQAACECVCDLHGMHHVEEDLLGAPPLAANVWLCSFVASVVALYLCTFVALYLCSCVPL